MNKWLATVQVEVYDNHNKDFKELTFQVLVEAETYGKASIAADKYVLDNLIRKIGPIEQL